MRIQVGRLPYLLQIARSGGVLAAAEAMNLTPSAVSQQLSRLEAEVGVPLVDRGPRGITPTAAGRELIDLAENVEREVNEAALRVGAASDLPSGRVRLGTFQSFISGILAPSLAQWRDELAGVQLEVVEDSHDDLLRGVRAADYDIVVVEFDESSSPPPLGPGMREFVLIEDPWVLVAPAGTQAAMGVIELDRLRSPWLELDGGSGGVPAVQRVRRRLTDSITSQHRYAEHLTGLALVAAGEGVTLMPQLALEAGLPDGVEAHELPGLGFRKILVRYRHGRRPSPATLAAVEFLQTLISSTDAHGRQSLTAD